MNEVEVAPGDAVFVRPGLLHATGAGVFLVEAQEPTDFSIMAEYKGYPIDPDIAHMHRGWDTMLDVIDSAAVSPDELSVLCGQPQPRGRQRHGGLDRRTTSGARRATPTSRPSA